MNRNQVFTILRDAGGIRAARVITENTQKFSRIKVWRIAQKLRKNVPVAKIIGQKWFFGLKFYTNKNTLDPRPDTETLVSAVIADCIDVQPLRVLDLGTGTGCIIAALCKNISKMSGIGVDISRGARRVARRNVRDLGLGDLVKIQRGNFMRPMKMREKFDIIVSNPPYIAANDTRVDAGAAHDPHLALYAGNNGLVAYMAIAKNARDLIKSNGRIYLEIGDGQMADVCEIFTNQGWQYVRADSDLGGIIRVLVFDYK